ncbi:hypothetical protein KR215_009425 [Drosophila sulfurigaster]|nr:hypothetical protein KR215_009425 [Drosophila sulfurigaster]
MLFGVHRLLPLLLLCLLQLLQTTAALPQRGVRFDSGSRLPYEGRSEFHTNFKSPPFRSA